jgi:hypothetical protein
MKLLTQQTLKGIFYPKSVFTILLALVTVFACEVEEPVPTYTLTTSVSPSEGGKISLSPQEPNYVEGSQVTLTPEPNENWVFKQWEGDATGNTTPLQLTMTANKNVVGVFVKRDFPLNIKIEGEGSVEEKIVPNPSGREYPHGTTVELTPKPKEGWEFESWSGDLTGNESPKRITVDKQKNVTAKFKEIFYTANFIPILNLPTGVVFVSHSIHYEYNGKEYILGGGVNWNDPSHYRPPLVQLVRTNDNWEVINVFNEVEMSEIRNSEFSKDGKYIIISDHGPEWPDIQWPFSHVYIGEIKENDIIWNKVSKNPSFYHDASFGDLNGDGIVDAVGGHLGTRNGNNDNPHVYLGLAGNKFEELKNILPIAPEGGCCGDVEIYDLNKNGINEIIRIGGSWQKENMDGVEYNRNTNKFEIVFSIEGSIPDNYVTSLYSNIKKENYINNFRGYMPSDNRFKDFNGDGNIDFINEKDGLTIWYGDGKMNFSPMRLNIQATDQSGLGIWDKYYPMSGQRYFDIENDGDLDIVTKHFTLGNPNLNTGIKLYNMIYINDNGVFKRLSDQRYFVKNEDVKSSYPGSMFIPFLRKGKLCFIGYTFDNKGSGPFEVMLEIETNIPASYWYGN